MNAYPCLIIYLFFLIQEGLQHLNLAQPFYVGGLPDFRPLKDTLGVQRGLDGAVQRVLLNEEVWEDMLAVATGRRNVVHYMGPPCYPNPCSNNARCIPHLKEFRCRCTDGYFGTLCNESKIS